MDLAERLRIALEELELSQAELARRTGISRGTVNKIVNAKRQPNAAQLGLLAHELGLELDELLGEVEQGEELELMEQQLRKAVLRTQRAERARAEHSAAAGARCEQLERQVASLREQLASERGARDKQLEELRVTTRQAQVRAQGLELRLREVTAQLGAAHRETQRLRAQLGPQPDESDQAQELLAGSPPGSCPTRRAARYSTARAAGEFVSQHAGVDFTQLVMALALERGG